MDQLGSQEQNADAAGGAYRHSQQPVSRLSERGDAVTAGMADWMSRVAIGQYLLAIFLCIFALLKLTSGLAVGLKVLALAEPLLLMAAGRVLSGAVYEFRVGVAIDTEDSITGGFKQLTKYFLIMAIATLLAVGVLVLQLSSWRYR